MSLVFPHLLKCGVSISITRSSFLRIPHSPSCSYLSSINLSLFLALSPSLNICLSTETTCSVLVHLFLYWSGSTSPGDNSNDLSCLLKVKYSLFLGWYSSALLILSPILFTFCLLIFLSVQLQHRFCSLSCKRKNPLLYFCICWINCIFLYYVFILNTQDKHGSLNLWRNKLVAEWHHTTWQSKETIHDKS